MSYGFMALSASVAVLFAAFSTSPSYQLQNYGLGSGGTSNSSSNSYRLNASSGEVAGSPTAGTNDTIAGGSTQTRQANVPLAPTLSNGGGTYYNKLQFTIATSGSDSSDYSYSVAVSANNFVTTNYVQADGTLGATAVYRSYSAWGGASGAYAIGLQPATAYAVKVNAMQGNFTASSYGAAATASTANPSLTFSVTPTTVNLGSLLAGTVVSGASPITFAFATNGAGGGSVYIAGNNAGLRSSSANYVIPAVSADLNGQNQGFGVQGLAATQTSGGPFTISSPFNGTSNTTGAEASTFKQLFSATSPVYGASGTAVLKGRASATTPSAQDYSETLTFIASVSF